MGLPISPSAVVVRFGCDEFIALYLADGNATAHPLRGRRVARSSGSAGRASRSIRGLLYRPEGRRDAGTSTAAGRTGAAGRVWDAARTWGSPRHPRLFGKGACQVSRKRSGDPGLLVLHDLATGVPLAVMESSYLTALRTGLVGALGADVLARPTAST